MRVWLLVVILVAGCVGSRVNSEDSDPAMPTVTPAANLTFEARILDESMSFGAIMALITIHNNGSAPGYVAPLNSTASVIVWDMTSQAYVEPGGTADYMEQWNDSDLEHIDAGANETVLYASDAAREFAPQHEYEIRFFYGFYPNSRHNITVDVWNQAEWFAHWTAPQE